MYIFGIRHEQQDLKVTQRTDLQDTVLRISRFELQSISRPHTWAPYNQIDDIFY